MADERLWQCLVEETPERFCCRTGAELDAATGCIHLPVLTGTLVLDPAAQSVEWLAGEGADPATFPDLRVEATATNYLLSVRELPFVGKWISPQELPSGAMFLRGQHALPTAELEAAFGEGLDAFKQAAERLGGSPLTFADASYEFRVLPRVKLAVLLWRGDDEFPARARFLVDDSLRHHLALDAVLGIAHLVTDRLIATV